MLLVLASAATLAWATPPWCGTTLTGSGSFSMTASQYTNNIANCVLELVASPGQAVCVGPVGHVLPFSRLGRLRRQPLLFPPPVVDNVVPVLSRIYVKFIVA